MAVEDLCATGEYERVYNLRIADYHTYFVGDWDWGFSVWSHNQCDYKLRENRLAYRFHVSGPMQRLVDEAIQYRLDHQVVTGGQNIAVVLCQRNGGPEEIFCVPSLPGSVHSEPYILAEVLNHGFTADDIIALYTERTPCRDCRSLLGPYKSPTSLGLPESKVYWSFDYDVERSRIAGYINRTISGF